MATILITGANRGVGLALASGYLARGDRVIATVRNPSKGSRLQDLASGSGRLGVLPLDVTDAQATERMAAAISDQAIDVLICNSGIMGSRGGIEDPGNDAAEWARMMATNVTGAVLTVRATLPAVLRAKAGKIALISTQMASSELAGGNCYSYRASKAALANVGINLAVELKPRGVGVGIYHPGWVKTDMGGSSAQVTPEDSAMGLIRRIDLLSVTTTGVFEDYRGSPFTF